MQIRQLCLGSIACLALLSGGLFANEGNLAFIGATLIDGTGADPLENATLVVTDGRVRALGPVAEVGIPADATRIKPGKVIMPGLINAHGHAGDTLGLETGHYSRANLLDQLGLYARYGVTTVVSLGGDGVEGITVRNEQHQASLDRARLFVAGTVVNGSDSASIRRQVNDNADMGVDFIKTRIETLPGELPTISPQLFESLVQLAHTRRLPVAVHIYYLDDAKMALRAGADVIAHSVRDEKVDQEFIELLRANDVCYIPTMMRDVSTFVYEAEPEFFADPFFLREADTSVMTVLRSPEYRSRIRNSAAVQQYKADLPNAIANVATLHSAGIRVAMGTDTGPPARFQGYFEHLEMSMMQDAGMPATDVIHASTGLAADCMGLSDVGTLEPGNWADFLILGTDPTRDVNNTRSLESVWIAGNRVPDR